MAEWISVGAGDAWSWVGGGRGGGAGRAMGPRSKDDRGRKTKGSQLEGFWAGKADSGACCASGIFWQM